MDYEKFWSYFAYFYFAVHTLCLIELIDMILYEKPYITIFLVVFSICCYYNYKLYKLLIRKKITMEKIYSFFSLSRFNENQIKPAFLFLKTTAFIFLSSLLKDLSETFIR